MSEDAFTSQRGGLIARLHAPRPLMRLALQSFVAGTWLSLLLSIFVVVCPGGLEHARDVTLDLVERAWLHKIPREIDPRSLLGSLSGAHAIFGCFWTLVFLLAGLPWLLATRKYLPHRLLLSAGLGLAAGWLVWIEAKTLFILSADDLLSGVGATPSSVLALCATAASIGVFWAATSLISRHLCPWRLRGASFLAPFSWIACVGVQIWSLSPRHSNEAPQAPVSTQRKVIILGIDSATWTVLHPLIDSGKLPNFRKVRQCGAWGDLRTTYPVLSPACWTTLATGARVQNHGISDFFVLDPKTGSEILTTSEARKTPALWNVITGFNKEVHVYGWWTTWPVEQVKGVMVSPQVMLGGLPSVVFPQNEETNIQAIMADVDRTLEHSLSQYPGLKALGEVVDSSGPEITSSRSKHWREIKSSFRRDQTMANLLIQSLDDPENRSDLIMVCLTSLDTVQHRFWGDYVVSRGGWLSSMMYANLQKEGNGPYKTIVPSTYLWFDEVLGKTLDRMGDRDILLIVSDHGSGPTLASDYLFRPNRLFEALGWLKFSNKDAEQIDWRQTVLFDRGHASRYGRPLFINGTWRGPRGCVLPGPDADRLKEEIWNVLIALRTDSGRRVVRLVPGSSGKGPDYVATFDPACAREKIVLPGGATIEGNLLIEDLGMTGTHRMNGIIALFGQDVKPGERLRNCSILDLTPTVLAVLGIPPASDMPGRVLREAFNPDLDAALPLGRTETYQYLLPMPGPAPPRDDTKEREALKGLGYL